MGIGRVMRSVGDSKHVRKRIIYETLYMEEEYNTIEVPQAGQNGFVRIGGSLNSLFGMRPYPITGKQKLHAGID